MEGASAMVHGKAAALGIERAVSASINIENDSILLAYGYPAAMNDECLVTAHRVNVSGR